jgi:hypothetical protein
MKVNFRACCEKTSCFLIVMITREFDFSGAQYELQTKVS